MSVVLHGQDLTDFISAWLRGDATALELADAARRYSTRVGAARVGTNKDSDSWLWEKYGPELEVLLRALDELEQAARELAVTGGSDRRTRLAVASASDQLGRVTKLIDYGRLPE